MEKLKPQELRPGNYLIINRNPVKILGVTDEGIILNKGSKPMPFDYFEPIPLTEELLLKARADQQYDDSFIISGFVLCKESDGFYIRDDEDKYVNDIPIESFHHLQNLVFDLTGQELTLNL